MVIYTTGTTTGADCLDPDSDSIGLGLTQNGDAIISLFTAVARFDWLGWRLTLPRIQPIAERFDESHSLWEG